jgi:hypothetical protein
VCNLVPEMPEQRSIGLAHLMAPTLAFGVIGLGEIDSDEAVVVTSEDRQRSVAEKVESEAIRILRLGDHRQSQFEQCVEQTVLGALHHTPMDKILRLP